MAQAGLAALAAVDAAGLTAAEQAGCLRALERAESMHAAARARLLRAFHAGGGYQDDGQGSARTWLAWQTRITRGAATGAMGWMRRLAAHPAVGAALAAGQLSCSWARLLCGWTDQLPAGCRADADAILLGAAADGAELAGLAQLAEEIRRRTAGPDTGGDGGFTDRGVTLDVTFGQAGKLNGDLTPQATAALSAVLEALGKKAGPEDTRTMRQRRHDALEEACRRLIAAGCVPARAGQPTQIQLHLTLDQLRGLDGGGGEAAWAARRGRRPGRARTATPPSCRSSPATSTSRSWTSSPPRCSAPPAGRGCGRSARTPGGAPRMAAPPGITPPGITPPGMAPPGLPRPGLALRGVARPPAGGCGPSGPPGGSSWPAPPTCCRGPAGWPPTCGPGCPAT